MERASLVANLKDAEWSVRHALAMIAGVIEAVEQEPKRDWPLYGSLRHFETELREFLSSDSGEAGFSSFVARQSK